MATKSAAVIPPSRLSQVLKHLTSGHRPNLSSVKSLKLKYAFRNDHWGARHFVKNDLPRIRYANPRLEIEVDKVLKTKEESWKPEMAVELRDGTVQKIDMDAKWSSTIYQELMDLGGGTSWARWKEERTAAGLPVVDVPLPKAQSPRLTTAPSPFVPDPSKTGAAAVLP